MAGGSPEHGALAAAFLRELGAALRGKPCRVFSSDVRAAIPETGLTTYPDASVVCGRLDPVSR
jgi:Uma2 family endonuclease